MTENETMPIIKRIMIEQNQGPETRSFSCYD